MSRPLGDTLPDDLQTLLGGHELADRMGQAILIATTDTRGWPHLALVSYGEVVAADCRRLRLALSRASGTSGNLRRNGRLTLGLLGAERAYYVKALARAQRDPMDGFAHLTRFEAMVEMVLADEAREEHESGARLTGGITFHPGRPVEETLQGWQAVVDALRRDA